MAWYVYRQDFQSLGLNEPGYPEYRHRQTSMTRFHSAWLTSYLAIKKGLSVTRCSSVVAPIRNVPPGRLTMTIPTSPRGRGPMAALSR